MSCSYHVPYRFKVSADWNRTLNCQPHMETQNDRVSTTLPALLVLCAGIKTVESTVV